MRDRSDFQTYYLNIHSRLYELQKSFHDSVLLAIKEDLTVYFNDPEIVNLESSEAYTFHTTIITLFENQFHWITSLDSNSFVCFFNSFRELAINQPNSLFIFCEIFLRFLFHLQFTLESTHIKLDTHFLERKKLLDNQVRKALILNNVLNSLQSLLSNGKDILGSSSIQLISPIFSFLNSQIDLLPQCSRSLIGYRLWLICYLLKSLFTIYSIQDPWMTCCLKLIQSCIRLTNESQKNHNYILSSKHIPYYVSFIFNEQLAIYFESQERHEGGSAWKKKKISQDSSSSSFPSSSGSTRKSYLMANVEFWNDAAMNAFYDEMKLKTVDSQGKLSFLPKELHELISISENWNNQLISHHFSLIDMIIHWCTSLFSSSTISTFLDSKFTSTSSNPTNHSHTLSNFLIQHIQSIIVSTFPLTFQEVFFENKNNLYINKRIKTKVILEKSLSKASKYFDMNQFHYQITALISYWNKHPDNQHKDYKTDENTTMINKLTLIRQELTIYIKIVLLLSKSALSTSLSSLIFYLINVFTPNLEQSLIIYQEDPHEMLLSQYFHHITSQLALVDIITLFLTHGTEQFMSFSSFSLLFSRYLDFTLVILSHWQNLPKFQGYFFAITTYYLHQFVYILFHKSYFILQDSQLTSKVIETLSNYWKIFIQLLSTEYLLYLLAFVIPDLQMDIPWDDELQALVVQNHQEPNNTIYDSFFYPYYSNLYTSSLKPASSSTSQVGFALQWYLCIWSPSNLNPNVHTLTHLDLQTLYKKGLKPLFSEENQLSTSLSSSKDYFQMLPQELLIYIFSFLTYKKVCKIAHLSKSFANCLENNLYWEAAYKRNFMQFIFEDELIIDHEEMSKIPFNPYSLPIVKVTSSIEQSYNGMMVCPMCYPSDNINIEKTRNSKAKKKKPELCPSRHMIHNWRQLFKFKALVCMKANQKHSNFRSCPIVGCDAIIAKKQDLDQYVKKIHFLTHLASFPTKSIK